MPDRVSDDQAYKLENGSDGHLRLLESIVDNATDVILVTEAEHIDEPGPKIVFVNESFTRNTGYTSEEVLGKTPRILQGPKTDRSQLDKIRSALPKDEQVEVELLNYRKDGTEFWVEIIIVPIADEHDQTTHYVSVQRDVTERKQQQEALKESEERLRTILVQYASDIITILEANGTIRYESPAVERTLGYKPEELVGKNILDYVHPEDVEGAVAELATIRNSPEARGPIEVRFRHKDGSWRHLEGIGNNLINDPEVGGVVINSRDVTGRKKAEDALKESEARYRGVVETAPDAIVVMNEAGTIDSFNAGAEHIFGYTPEDVVGRPASLLVPERLRASLEDVLRTYLQSGEAQLVGSTVELIGLRKRGQEFPMELSLGQTSLQDNLLFTSVIRDVSERKWEERRKNAQHDVTRILAEAPTVEDAAPQILQAICENLEWEVGGFWDLDHEAGKLHCIQTWNMPTVDVPAFVEITHQTTFSRGEGLLGRIWESGEPAWLSDVVEDNNYPRMPVALQEGLHGGFGFPILLGSKILGIVEFFSREVRQPDEDLLEMMAAIGSQVGQFIERKSFEEQVQHQAGHDDLTDLPNRTLFTDRLCRTLERVKRRKASVAVLFLDLDNFKYVNDTLGHDIGDRLLIAAAERLKECLRPEDTAARLGGDEFAVLLEEIQNPSEAERVAKRILHALSSPFDLDGHQQFASVSVGIVVTNGSAGGSGSWPGDLLRSADLAMYKAKALGKDRYAVFDPETERNAMQRLELENDLRSALERDEFKVHYQPLVLLKTGQVVGIEALVRWEHPRRGLVTPCEFIPVAEEIGLIVHIGDKVLWEACRQAREWQERYPYSPPLIVGVNLSARQLQHADLVDSIEKTLRETGLEPGSLTLEVTESVLIDDAEDHIATMRRLRDLGVRFAIDDFGTGYSSLSYLKRLPAGLLKMDGSFVERVTESTEDEVLLRGITDIAHGLDLSVVAEGVETSEQAALLESLGCDLAQGRYFSEPLAAGEAEAILAKHAPLRDAP